MAEHNNNGGRKEVSKVRIIACGVGLVIVLAVIALAVVLLQKQKAPDEQPEGQLDIGNMVGSGKIGSADDDESEPSSSEESETEKQYSETYFVSMNDDGDWYFPSSTEPSLNAVVANSELNECKVYFELIVDSTQEVVFKSPILEPGEMISDITLGKELESGTYPCTIIYHLLDPDTEEEYTTVVLGISIIIR